jgi:hypothetical protein
MKPSQFKLAQDDIILDNIDVYVLPHEGPNQDFHLDIDFDKAGLITVSAKDLELKGTGSMDSSA